MRRLVSGLFLALLGCGRRPAEERAARPVQNATPVSSHTASAPTPLSPDKLPFEAAYDVEIGALLSEYKANELRADGKFKGKLIHTHGSVIQVGKGLRGEPFVTLGSGARLEIPALQCALADPADSEAMGLSAGGKAAIVGRVERLLGHVQVKECVVNPMAHLCRKLIAAVGGVECSRYSTQPTGDVTAAIFETDAKHDDALMGHLECEYDGDNSTATFSYEWMMRHEADAGKPAVGSSRLGCFVVLIVVGKKRSPVFPEGLRNKVQEFFDAL